MNVSNCAGGHVEPDLPALALWQSLLALSTLEENAENFWQFSRNRRVAITAWERFLAELHKTDPLRCLELRKERPWCSGDDKCRPPLKGILTNARAWLKRAEAALANRGAKRLCEALGSRAVEVETSKQLSRASVLLFLLALSTEDGSMCEDYAVELATFGRWCGSTAASIRGVLTVDGVFRPQHIPGWDQSLAVLCPGAHVPLRPVADALPPSDPAASGEDSRPESKTATGAESPPSSQPPPLPSLGRRDREIYQMMLIPGMTQLKAAAELNKRFPTEHWTQPRVSEALKRAKAHAEASGLADKVSATRSQAPARTLDPAAADSGQRTDGRSKHLREKARQIAKEE